MSKNSALKELRSNERGKEEKERRTLVGSEDVKRREEE